MQKLIPPPKNSHGYTVKEACTILSLKKTQVYKLLKTYNIVKTANIMYIPKNQLQRIFDRKNRTIKDYDI
jgi:hypothetical protein